MQALQSTEQQRDPAPLVELYTEDGTSENLTRETHRGHDGAQQFWTAYLGNFQDIRSEFTHHADGERLGVMEWVSRGTLKDGRPIEYRGVSIIEKDGERVAAFRTYYDSAAFVAPAADTNGA